MAGDTKQAGDTTFGADGDTRRKNPLTWRPSPEAELALARLLDREGCSRGELLNRLVIAVDAGKLIPVEGDNPKVRVTKVVLPDAPPQLKTIRIKSKSDHAFEAAMASRPDPDKIDAFQRKAGMGGVKSRG